MGPERVRRGFEHFVAEERGGQGDGEGEAGAHREEEGEPPSHCRRVRLAGGPAEDASGVRAAPEVRF